MADLSLSQAAARFLATVAGEMAEFQGEVFRFVRWYGADRPVSELRGHEVSLYADALGQATPETVRRLEAVKSFLAFLKKDGLTTSNLASHLRLRRLMAEPVGPAVPENRTELTLEGQAALKAELKSLMAQRSAVAEELRQAMLDKDFRENAPLDAAREKQAHLEARIREMEATLKQAVIVGKGRPGARVQLGNTILLRDLSSGATVHYTIVGPAEANALEGKISSASPVGKALLAQEEGGEVEVAAPKGVLRFRIEQIEG